MNQSKGFTLIEILIALMIFAVLSVITAVGLRSVLQTNTHLKTADENLRQLITAVTIMRHDVIQIIARPVHDTSGEMLPALLIPNQAQFEFTRAGYTNPLYMSPRSTLQRVAYEFRYHSLYRITWPVLDRAPHTQSIRKPLLTHVKHFKFAFIDQKGQMIEVWSTTASTNALLPRAMIVTMDLEKMGQVKLVFPIQGATND